MTTLTQAPSVRWGSELAADLRDLLEVRDALAAALTSCGWSEEDAFRVLVCADEAVANALTHGSHGRGTIAAGFRVTPICATVVVADRNLAAGEVPESVPPPSESSEHGRGLILMRALADRLRMCRRPSGTTLALRFTHA